MFTSQRGRLAAGILAAGTVLALTGCGAGGDPLEPGSEPSGDGETIIVGSAGFAESEIIAQIFAQALEANDVTVEFAGQIGQRDVYITALEDGSIDLIPDYSGNLLQFFDEDSDAKSSEEVFAALPDALPDGFEVLDQAEAEDKDSYNVTQEFSESNGVTSLADLANLDVPLIVGGNPELAERPYGPQGLTEVYGVDAANIQFVPISDSGGPLTTAALLDGTVNIADIFSTTPSIKENNFVTLEDPENMILPQNVLPLINSEKASDTVKEVLNAVSAELTTEDLIELNGRNQGDEKASPEALAADWLAEKDLF
ncbi:ABC transporter substrate-binding protein [Mycetocola manganoxydans]|uniref:ABC transporter substrate-binding protein n=1 Tax=Mycetocola manganoxydans TaxID=699879 RepID=A0A3L6ZY19_9MICO|nr:ABC transporter substrate-binding protein [Mycetocola manganoxydans]RLP72923.1 ABC transporter substrate-binding protein [Mycetocola manganoxydans]GHD44971.1 glycine/betaine ABC transporter permease [Mycetocola manganoxydans]